MDRLKSRIYSGFFVAVIQAMVMDVIHSQTVSDTGSMYAGKIKLRRIFQLRSGGQ